MTTEEDLAPENLAPWFNYRATRFIVPTKETPAPPLTLSGVSSEQVEAEAEA